VIDHGGRFAWLAILAIAACDRSLAEPGELRPVSPAIVRIDASDVIARFECNRCHEVPDTRPPPIEKQCVGCHQQIESGTFPAKPAAIERWRKRIVSLRHAPALRDSDRLRRDWVKQFLLHPHHVRPGSIAEMPRLAITDAEATRLATYLVPSEDETPLDESPDMVARGESLFHALACGRCHRFTGAAADDPALHAAGTLPGAAWTLAPDLRFARDRMQPARLAAWIASPRGAMPSLGIGADDARALAAFVATTPVAPQARPAVPARLPVLTRPVTWDEVSREVFHDRCWHCHAVPDLARGDGGPGNSGGFGFPPRGLDVSSYAGISEGAIDDDGERHSIFERLPDGTPRLIAYLMARYREEAGGAVDGIHGMPLGLPPLSLERIQLVESWIAQGRPM